ncbi:MAG: T9SS type A sorting domain-containing protein [Bacteroidetes bacterium]|nr:T9SS type A sorting domain-containing protein [Bacteroidota bacterium]
MRTEGRKLLATFLKKGYYGPISTETGEEMWTRAGIAGIVVGLLLGSALTTQGQGFEWKQGYPSYGFQQAGYGVRVSPGGMIYTYLQYWDIPPFQWDTGSVIEKYDDVGQRMWYLSWGGNGRRVNLEYRCDNDDNLYVLRWGNKLSKSSPESGTSWETTLANGYDKFEVSRDRIFLFTPLVDTGGTGIHRGVSIVQIDTMRREVWRRDTMFAQDVSITRTATYVDKSGNLYVSGTIEADEKDVFFLKFDMDGNLICGKRERGPVGRNEEGFGITADAAGNFYLLSKVDSSDNVNSAWITKYDPVGRTIWSKFYAKEWNLGLASIQTTPDDDILVGGGYGQGFETRGHIIFRVDTSGALQWQLPTEPRFAFAGMGIGPDNDLYFIGLTFSRMSSADGPYFAKYNAYPVAVETLPEAAAAPTACVLHQNYPNPFNPSTNITFSLPSRGEVLLTVFDHLGREVAILAHGEYEAGPHSCPFIGAELPSGVYMYRLDWNGKSVVRRMALLR